MEIYLSFSTKLYKRESETHKEDTINLFNLCVFLLNNLNYNVNIITDSEGYDWLKHLKVNSLTKELDSINFPYKDVWSASKLHVFNMLSKRKKPFIHIDHDFLIFKEFDQDILNADIVVQSIEFNLSPTYQISTFNNMCANKYHAENFNINFSYNCGIIGGNNYEFIEEYSESAIKMINDPVNSNFWAGDRERLRLGIASKAALAEQYYLACCLEKFNIKPTLFFDNSKLKVDYSPKQTFHFDNRKAIHLFGHIKEAKNVKESLNKVYLDIDGYIN